MHHGARRNAAKQFERRRKKHFDPMSQPPDHRQTSVVRCSMLHCNMGVWRRRGKVGGRNPSSIALEAILLASPVTPD
jgi:hypothetical protein